MPEPRWADHGTFGVGMVRDIPRHMLPEGAVWDALDAFISEDGTLNKRGSTVTALSSNSAISGSVVGYSQLDHDSTVVRGYVIDESNGSGGGLILGAFTPGSGTFAVTSTTFSGNFVSVNGVGRPFNHNGYLLVPVRAPAPTSTAYRLFYSMSGGVSSALSTTSAVTVTSGAKTTTGWSAGDVSNMAVGDIIFLQKSAANDRYFGRITAISGTTVSVTPTPTRGIAGTGGAALAIRSSFNYFDQNSSSIGVNSFRGAQCGASWQNRVLWGGMASEIASGVYALYPNRVVWSILPTETSAANSLADGDLWMSTLGMPVNNYFDVPWMDLIRGMEPVSDGEMLILGRPQCARLVGTLNTNSTTSGGLTYEVRPLNQKVQCINDRATCKTPAGVMMMGPDGIYVYQSGKLINTMVGRIQNYFLANIANATIYGSGLLGSNHYYLSTSAGLLLCNLNGYRWTRFQNVDIGNNFIDPQDTTRIFAARFQPGTSSNTTKLIRADNLINPSSSATTDVSGTGPTMTIQTKTYTEGDSSRLKWYRHIKPTTRMPGSSGTVTYSSTPGLDGEETGATLGTISNATSAQTTRYDITTKSRAFGLTVAQTGNPNECEFIDLDIASKPLRDGRTS